jgi:hypothetical protein
MVLFVPMKRRVLTSRQAALLRKLAMRYRASYQAAKTWQERTPNELWLKVLAAIAAPGNARAAFVIEHAVVARNQASLSRLKAFRSDAERLRHIHWILTTARTRYVRKQFRKDPKSRAALKNFHTLLARGGPKRFFREIAAKQCEVARIEALKAELAGYGAKTARDTAIELGLAKDCMALDIRLRGLLAAVGAQTEGMGYEDMERAMIQQVAKPGMTGGQLDRILFQNYDLILADIKLGLDRR